MADPVTLGSYTIDSVIFRGRRATSYLATHTVMRSQRVVLRVLSPDAAADQAFVAEFRAEAQVAARLKHDSVAGVLDLQQDGDTVFLVLEFVEGLDLATLFANFGPMPPAVASAIVRDVLRGLEHTHAAGIMHGRLRPRRIKVNPEGGVKILGFGVRESEAPAGTAPSADEQMEVAFRAPEQQEGEASVASDLFACGAILFRLLSGKLPYGDEGAAKSHDRPVMLNELTPLVPAPLAELVDHLLERKSEARPASASEVRLRLEDALEAMHVSVGADLVRDYLGNPRAAAESARQSALAELMRVARDLADGPPPDPQAAMRVLQRVLKVDPVNEVARAFMQELEGGDDKTMVMTTPFKPESVAAAPPPPAPKPAPAPPPAPKAEPRPEPKPEPKPAPPPAPKPEPKPAPPKPAEKPVDKPAAARKESPAARKSAAASEPAGFARYKGLLIGLGAVVVLGVVVLGVVLTRKPKPVVEEPPAATAGATLDIATQPTGAIVQVKTSDGARTGTSNTMFEGLPPGTWPVHVELAGYLPRDTSVTLTAGGTQALEVVLGADAAAKTCSLYVTVKPRADQVLINGKPASGKETLFWTVLDAGRYKIEASAKGFLPTSERGKANAGDVKRIALMLNAAPTAPAAPAPGQPAPAAPAVANVAEPADGVTQQIRVTPKCDIWVDGQLRASNAAALDVKLAPGKHDVQFKHPDFAVMRRSVTIKAGKGSSGLQVDLTRGEGGISVRAARGGLRIFVDDKSSGQTTPGVVRGLKPGRHKVDIREKDGVTVVASQSVIVEDSASNQVVQF